MEKKENKKSYRTLSQIVGFRCLDCKDILLFSRKREFRTCKCGNSSGDAGDGFYYRLMGQADGLMTLVENKKSNKKPNDSRTKTTNRR